MKEDEGVAIAKVRHFATDDFRFGNAEGSRTDVGFESMSEKGFDPIGINAFVGIAGLVLIGIMSLPIFFLAGGKVAAG